MNSNWSNSPVTLNSGQNWQFFVTCDLEIWWMTLKNNRVPLLCCFKLCASFYSHHWIQIGVTVRKRPIWVKIGDLCIISKPSVNLNWSYSPETPNSGQNRRFFVPCDLEIWRMSLKNNRAPLLCCFKLCAVRKHPIWVKIDDFFSRVTLKFDGWHWKTIGHLS